MILGGSFALVLLIDIFLIYDSEDLDKCQNRIFFLVIVFIFDKQQSIIKTRILLGRRTIRGLKQSR